MFAATMPSRLLRLPPRWVKRRTACIGMQWIGEQCALASVQHAGTSRVTALNRFDVSGPQRAELVERLARDGVFAGARVRVLLAPGQYDLHLVPTPAVPPEEMREALRWQLRGALSCPPEEAVLDFVTLPATDATAGAANRQSLLAVSARRAVVLEAVAPLVAARIEIDAVDVPEFAQRELALRCGSGRSTGSLAWLGFDSDTCLFTVACRDAIAFTRRMLLPGEASDEGRDPTAHFCERVATQIQRSIDMYERQSGLPPVDRLVLGPHRHTSALARLLRESLAAAVEEFDPAHLTGVDLGEFAAQCSGLTLPSLGAALHAPVEATAARRAA